MERVAAVLCGGREDLTVHHKSNPPAVRRQRQLADLIGERSMLDVDDARAYLDWAVVLA
jgi:hypothetical protein